MRCTLRLAATLGCVALFCQSDLNSSQAAAPATLDRCAELVRQALEAEAAGSPERREQLLSEALAIDPDFAPARWQSGFVRVGNDWIEVDDVPAHTVPDATLTAYRKQRDALVDTADNQRQLARWCAKHRLPDEARVHWAKVLEFDAQDAAALDALGLQLYEGRLRTRSQIAQDKIAAGQRLRAARRWQPQFLAWRSAIENGTPAQREQALAELERFDEADALGALEAVFARDGRGEKIVAVNRALLDSVGRLPGPEATAILLRRAVLGEPEEVRQLAADELKKRPMHAYVPQLIAALPGKLQTRFNVFVLPGGMVLHEHEVFVEGENANYSFALESVVNSADAAMAAFVAPAAYQREIARAATIEEQLRGTADERDFVRGRVQAVLERTTGFKNPGDAQLWQRQYEDYYGWQTHVPEKPTYNFVRRNYEAYATPPADLLETTTHTLRDPNFHMSCFPAGTTIATLDGPRPIETVRVGDRVLAQDPQSGELDYKPVQATSLRAGVELLQIEVGSESILATPGHPFWVVDAGWRTAAQLQPGDRLHCLNGPVEVVRIESSRSREVYNFVVSDWHNYFVGDSRLLVHDNSPLIDPAQRVPGLAALQP